MRRQSTLRRPFCLILTPQCPLTPGNDVLETGLQVVRRPRFMESMPVVRAISPVHMAASSISHVGVAGSPRPIYYICRDRTKPANVTVIGSQKDVVARRWSRRTVKSGPEASCPDRTGWNLQVDAAVVGRPMSRAAMN